MRLTQHGASGKILSSSLHTPRSACLCCSLSRCCCCSRCTLASSSAWRRRYTAATVSATACLAAASAAAPPPASPPPRTTIAGRSDCAKSYRNTTRPLANALGAHPASPGTSVPHNAATTRCAITPILCPPVGLDDALFPPSCAALFLAISSRARASSSKSRPFVRGAPSSSFSFILSSSGSKKTKTFLSELTQISTNVQTCRELHILPSISLFTSAGEPPPSPQPATRHLPLFLFSRLSVVFSFFLTFLSLFFSFFHLFCV